MGEKNTIVIKKMIYRAEKIINYCKGIDKETFLEKEEIIELCAFNLMQIGELVSLLSDGFIAEYPSIPWFKMRGLRNRIVHDYSGVDHQLIWEIITCNLKDLIKQLRDITA